MKKARFILAFLVVAVMIVPAYALTTATDDGYFGASYNRAAYTPMSCTVNITGTTASFTNLRWEGNNFSGSDYWEGELRGTQGYSISDAYLNATGITSSLPNAYREYDDDDMSIGCKNMSQIAPAQTYYAVLNATKGPRFDSGVELIVESETGTWLIIDGLPLRYQVFEQTLNTKSRRMIGW